MTTNVVALQSADLERSKKADKRSPEQAWAARKIEFVLAVQRDPALPPTAKLLATALVLRHFWWTTWRCDPSIETLAEDIGGYGATAVGCSLKALVENGWFRAQRRPNRTTNYIPVFDDGTAPSGEVRNSEASDGRKRILSTRRRGSGSTENHGTGTLPAHDTGDVDSHGDGTVSARGSIAPPGHGRGAMPERALEPCLGVAPASAIPETTPELPVSSPFPPVVPQHLAAAPGVGEEKRDLVDDGARRPCPTDDSTTLVTKALDRIAVVKGTARRFWEPLVTHWIAQHGAIALDVVTEEVANGASRETLQERVTAHLARRSVATGAGGGDLDEFALTALITRFERDFLRHWGKSRPEIEALLTAIAAINRGLGQAQPRRAAWEALRNAYYSTRQADDAGRAAAWAQLYRTADDRRISATSNAGAR